MIAEATRVELVVPGSPVPWARARSGKGRVYTPEKNRAWAQRVQTAWLVEGRPRFEAGAPLALSATFYFARPPSHLRVNGEPRSSAPAFPPRADVSNLVKGVEDALNLHLWHDDSQIVLLENVRKLYVANGDEPRTELEVRTV